MSTAKRFYNSSKRDYVEEKQAECENCGGSFTDSRIVWGGKPATNFRGTCENCWQCSLLPPIPLLTTKPRTQVSLKSDVRMKPEDVDLIRSKNVENLTVLYCLAGNGDERALQVLLELGFLLTHFLEVFARRQPEKLRPYARKELAWPMFTGPKRGKTNETLLRNIELARDIKLGKWNPEARTTSAALVMWVWLCQNCAELKLPPFDRQTAKQWFEKGWSAVLYATRGKPEKDEFLRQTGEHRKRHSEQIGQQSHATAATREANIRDGIKWQLWQSFQNFVPKSP